MKRLAAVLISAVLWSACDGSSRPPTAPTGPTPTPTPTPAPEPPVATYYTLSGIVFEVTPTGRVPIEGVSVYCDGCGSPTGHTQVLTDADGLYSLAWSQNGPTPLQVGKIGYVVVGKANEFPTAMVSGDTRFDIELARR